MRASSRTQGIKAVHPLRKDLAARLALLAIAFEAGKGQLPKALHVKGVAQDSERPRMRNATHKIRLYSEVP